MTQLWDELVGQLRSLPVLPGARCRGRTELFDATITAPKGRPDDLEYARAAALQLCADCPALHGCRDWLASLPADQRPSGVIAGQVIAPGKPRGFRDDLADRTERFAALRATGMSYRAIAEATGSSEPTVRRALTQHTDTTPKGPHDMTNSRAADNRRATAITCHFGRMNIEGLNAILQEAVDHNRVTPLIAATLDLHAHTIPILLTPDGLACLTAAIYTLTQDPNLSDDTSRAARLVIAHSEQDGPAFNAVLHEAADADHVTELVVAVLSLFSTLMPILYSELGLQVLERSILDWAAREGQDDQ